MSSDLISSVCVMCHRTPEHGTVMLTRKRPTHRSEYEICLSCARKVKLEQDERAQAAIEVAERAGV